MNPFDFVKASGSGDSLMPIIIFIIWIAISFFSNAQKKKKKLEQQRAREAYRTPEPEPQEAVPETMVQNEEHRVPVYDEIRRELETVLSEERTAEESAETPQDESGYSLESQQTEEQSYDKGVVLETAPSTGVGANPTPVSVFASSAYDLAASDGIESSAIGDLSFEESDDQNFGLTTITGEEVRRGVVWAEILGAPRALKDLNTIGQ